MSRIEQLIEDQDYAIGKTNTASELQVSVIESAADGFSVEEHGGGGPIVGSMINFTQDGQFKVDKTTILPQGTTLVALDVTTAWVKFFGGKLIDYRVTPPGREHPEKEDMPDRDEASWEIGLDGDRVDPWHDSRYLHLCDPVTAAEYTFVTDTFGGRRAIRDLKRQISNMRCARPNAIPVVKLTATQWKTSFGMRPRPDFQVVDWRIKNPAGSARPIIKQVAAAGCGAETPPAPEQAVSELEPPPIVDFETRDYADIL